MYFEPTEVFLTCRQQDFNQSLLPTPLAPKNTTFLPIPTQTIPAVTPHVIRLHSPFDFAQDKYSGM